MQNFSQFNLVGGFTLALVMFVAVEFGAPKAHSQMNYDGQAAVTQITSGTTGVTSNAPASVITTVSLSNAANVDVAFVLTNSAINAGSCVQATVDGYSGIITTNGTPYTWVSGIAAGSCTVHVTNLHPANALSGTVKVGIKIAN